MAMKYAGKKALVTGASSGIGRSIAMRLAREGADVYMLDVDTAGLEDVLVEMREFGVCAVAEYCDLSDPGQISNALRTMLHRWGPIDVLVNNAGVGFYGPTETMTADQWNRLLAINLQAPIQITRELLPSLMDRPGVGVLNVCSVYGLVAGPRYTAYHTSKFGLVGFSEALRAEYGRRGMNVSALCPGTVMTPMYDHYPTGRPDQEAPRPPRWLSTTPDRVARIALTGLARNRKRIVITPAAHAVHTLNRLAPWLIDFVSQFGRSRKLRKLRRQAAKQGAPATPAALDRAA